MPKKNDVLGEFEQFENITELQGGDSGELPKKAKKKSQNKGAKPMAKKQAKKQNKKVNKTQAKKPVSTPQYGEFGGGGSSSSSKSKSKKSSTKKLPKTYAKMTKYELYEHFKKKNKKTSSTSSVSKTVRSSSATKDKFKNPLNILIETGAKEFRPLSETEEGSRVSIKIDELFGLYAFVYKYVSKVFKKFWISAYNVYKYFDQDELNALRKGYGMPAVSTTAGALSDADILNYVCSDDAEEKTLALINESPSSIVPTLWKTILYEFMNWTDYAGIVKLPEARDPGIGGFVDDAQEMLRRGYFEDKFVGKFKQFLSDKPIVKLVVPANDMRAGYSRKQLVNDMLEDPENKAVLAKIGVAFTDAKYDDVVDYGDDESSMLATRRAYNSRFNGMPDDYAGGSNDEFGDVSANEMVQLGLNVDDFLQMSPLENAVLPMANMELFGRDREPARLTNLGNSDTRFTDDIVDNIPHKLTFASAEYTDDEIEAEIEAAATLNGNDEPSGFMDDDKGFGEYIEDAEDEVIDAYL